MLKHKIDTGNNNSTRVKSRRTPQCYKEEFKQLIQAHAINCVFEGNKSPFDLVEDIQLNGHYWDESN